MGAIKIGAMQQPFSGGNPLLSWLEHRRLTPVYWAALSLAVLAGDYATGPFVQLPFLFLLPTAMASWYSSRRWGLILSFILPSVRIFFSTIWKVPWTILEATINGMIQMAVLAAFAFLIDQVVQKQRLTKEIQVLRGFLPICSFCKKIHDQDNNWNSIEKYITERSEAKFSHTVCPACAKEHYPELFRE
jgi:hypothetical protein